MEQCAVEREPDGFYICGIVLAPIEAEPALVGYSVTVDKAWKTRAARVNVDVGERRLVRLESDGEGHWSLDDSPCEELTGCLDVDIEISPSTNMIPIRRLNLQVGQSAKTTAAWIRVPGLTVERLEQTYARLGATTYRYRSGNFTALLEVDEDGLVLDYEGLWRTIAKKTTGAR
jgi:hypothetical protein